MKVVLFGSFSPDSKIGGVTTHCDRLSSRLSTEDIVVKRINCAPRSWSICSFISFFFCAVSVLAKKDDTLSHFQTSYRNIPFLILSPMIFAFRKKAIISFHSGKLCERLDGSRVDRFFFFYAGLIAKRIIVMNEDQMKGVVELFPSLSRKIRVIHSFVFPVQKNEGGKELKVGDGQIPFRISSMGAWLDYYRFEDSVEAVLRLAKKERQRSFVLKIGVALFNVDECYKFKMMLLKNSTESLCDNLEIYSEEDVRDPLGFIEDSDVFIRSSSVDSFGLCVAEAVFLGRPAIATNVCRRVNGVLLYDACDVDALSNILESVFRKIESGNLEKIVLDEKEDAFPLLLNLYREVENS